MSDFPNPAHGFVLMIAILLGICLLGAGFTADYWKNKSQREAIAHHAARYNPITGAFEWLDDIPKDTK